MAAGREAAGMGFAVTRLVGAPLMRSWRGVGTPGSAGGGVDPSAAADP
jgi:hypothetical protein